MPQRELLTLRPEIPDFGILHSFLHNFFIQTPNHTILVFTESPRSLEFSHSNEGAIEGHNIG